MPPVTTTKRATHKLAVVQTEGAELFDCGKLFTAKLQSSTLVTLAED